MTPRAAWALSVDPDRIAWLTLDKPDAGANALSRDVLTELDARLADLERIAPRGVVVISGKDSGFIAGADIKEFTTLEDTADAEALIDHGQRVLARLERLPCPTVAALHGFALGGGLELALACRYRVAVEDERLALGLPEVMLGIHPGFGGTVRAVRLIGALDAPTSGELRVMGTSLGSLSRRARARLRLGSIGFVFQAFHLLPYLSVTELCLKMAQLHSTFGLATSKTACRKSHTTNKV